MGARMTSPALTRIILIVAALVLAADQLTKWWVVEAMGLEERLVIPVLPPFLTFKMAWNTGINFGLFGGGSDATRFVLIAITLLVSAALVWWVLRRGNAPMAYGAGLVLGGALGNGWDRLTRGAVADFLNTSCCGINNPFSFNVADIAIFAGAVWIALKA
jgi:signal peptidase II